MSTVSLTRFVDDKRESVVTRFIVVGAFTVILCAPIFAPGKGSVPSILPSAVETALNREFPSMRLIEERDIDSRSCRGLVTTSPGSVSVDFNGDGIEDYAALLVGVSAKRNEKWEGKDWPVYDFRLVALLTSKDGSFDIRTLFFGEDSIPTIHIIKLQSAGTLREVGTGRAVKLERPGIEFDACEKYSVVFFFEGTQFRKVGIGG